MTNHFDVVWIGTGQATFTVVPRLAAAGKRVAIIEGGEFGGTCVNYGCTPTKTLVASAYAIHLARRGADFGFSVEGLEVDFAKVMQAQQVNRRNSSASIESGLAKLGTLFRGYAEFVDATTVRVDARRLTADTIVIHTGTRPVVPKVAGLESVEYLTNESLLDLKKLPDHLAIVGSSYIALEFAQVFRRLGSQVTILARGPRLLGREDEDVSSAALEILAAEGINVIFNAALEKLGANDGVELHGSLDGKPTSLKASHILFAIGRAPNSDLLNASAAGLALSRRGFIEVNDVMQTSVPHIYAVGDVNGRGAFTHTSVNDGEIFWDHYARSMGISTEPVEFDRSAEQRNFVSAMFIDPPLARVGMNETEARASGRKVLIARAPMTRVARAREKRETNGLVKILVDAETEQILGATVFGTGGDEVIGSFAAFMSSGLSWKHFRRVVFPHPTVSELMPWIMDGLTPLD